MPDVKDAKVDVSREGQLNVKVDDLVDKWWADNVEVFKGVGRIWDLAVEAKEDLKARIKTALR